jgi:hypothetical protein
MHGSDEAVVIALDVENNAVVRDEACGAVTFPRKRGKEMFTLILTLSICGHQ